MKMWKIVLVISALKFYTEVLCQKNNALATHLSKHTSQSGTQGYIGLTDVTSACFSELVIRKYLPHGTGVSDADVIFLTATTADVNHSCTVKYSTSLTPANLGIVIVLQFTDGQGSQNHTCADSANVITLKTLYDNIDVCKSLKNDTSWNNLFVELFITQEVEAHIEVKQFKENLKITSSSARVVENTSDICDATLEIPCEVSDASICVDYQLVCDENSNCGHDSMYDEDYRICQADKYRRLGLVVLYGVIILIIFGFFIGNILYTCVPHVADNFFIFNEDEDNRLIVMSRLENPVSGRKLESSGLTIETEKKSVRLIRELGKYPLPEKISVADSAKTGQSIEQQSILLNKETPSTEEDEVRGDASGTDSEIIPKKKRKQPRKKAVPTESKSQKSVATKSSEKPEVLSSLAKSLEEPAKKEIPLSHEDETATKSPEIDEEATKLPKKQKKPRTKTSSTATETPEKPERISKASTKSTEEPVKKVIPLSQEDEKLAIKSPEVDRETRTLPKKQKHSSTLTKLPQQHGKDLTDLQDAISKEGKRVSLPTETSKELGDERMTPVKPPERRKRKIAQPKREEQVSTSGELLQEPVRKEVTPSQLPRRQSSKTISTKGESRVRIRSQLSEEPPESIRQGTATREASTTAMPTEKRSEAGVGEGTRPSRRRKRPTDSSPHIFRDERMPTRARPKKPPEMRNKTDNEGSFIFKPSSSSAPPVSQTDISFNVPEGGRLRPKEKSRRPEFQFSGYLGKTSRSQASSAQIKPVTQSTLWKEDNKDQS